MRNRRSSPRIRTGGGNWYAFETDNSCVCTGFLVSWLIMNIMGLSVCIIGGSKSENFVDDGDAKADDDGWQHMVSSLKISSRLESPWSRMIVLMMRQGLG